VPERSASREMGGCASVVESALFAAPQVRAKQNAKEE
jgi:hypothetical protein